MTPRPQGLRSGITRPDWPDLRRGGERVSVPVEFLEWLENVVPYTIVRPRVPYSEDRAAMAAEAEKLRTNIAEAVRDFAAVAIHEGFTKP